MTPRLSYSRLMPHNSPNCRFAGEFAMGCMTQRIPAGERMRMSTQQLMLDINPGETEVRKMHNNTRAGFGICSALIGLSAAVAAGCASVPESVEISDIEEIAAVVTAIDQGRRLVTLRGEEGDELTFRASPEVRNLAQVRVGDIVRMSYEQTYVATRSDAQDLSPEVPVVVGAARAEPGERPAGMVGAVTMFNVRIESVGPNGRSVTYVAPDGELEAIELQREEAQAFVRSLRPGDIVELTYVESLAITVDPI